MSDENDIDDELVDLDVELLHAFTTKIEEAINEVIKTAEVNPFVELLSVLVSMSTQISIDIGFSKEEYINFINDIYNEAQQYSDNANEDEIQKEIAKTLINLPSKKLN